MVEAFREKLRQGGPVLVVNPDRPAPGLVEFLGRLPVDAVFIDCEHGSASLETVENMTRAARLAGLISLIRIFSPEDWVIERYLGLGADGLVVPRLETGAQAEAALAALRYARLGQPGERLFVVQIETRGALEGLEDFLAVDGIDAYFIGPNDLAKSLGYEGDYRRPEVQEAIDGAIAQILLRGRTAGILVDRGNVRGYVEKGVRFLYAHANEFLVQGAEDFRRALDGA